MPKELLRWDPFSELSLFRDNIERLFDTFFGRLPRERHETFWSPPIDIEDAKDTIVVRAEIPGMKKEEIKVTLTKDTLTISGEKKHESEEKGKTFHRIERSYGKFQRTVSLPTEVLVDKAKASYKDGILQLTLPKSEKAKAKEIAIEIT